MVNVAVSWIENRNRSMSMPTSSSILVRPAPCARNSKLKPMPASVIPKARTLTLAEPPSTNR